MHTRTHFLECHDASDKNFFTHPRTVADTLRAAASDIARHLDFATLERMPASFVTEHLGQRHTDMLWRIGTIDGGWVYILILLEFQSTVDRRMALRMMDYTATIWMRLGKEDLGPAGTGRRLLGVDRTSIDAAPRFEG